MERIGHADKLEVRELIGPAREPFSDDGMIIDGNKTNQSLLLCERVIAFASHSWEDRLEHRARASITLFTA
jgi:hypothetical protein